MGNSKRIEREPGSALRPHLGDQRQDWEQSAVSLRHPSLSRVSRVSCWKPHQGTIPNLITLFDIGLSSLKITFLLCLWNATLPSSGYECCKLIKFGEQGEADIHPGHRLINRHVSLYAKERKAGFWRGNCHGDAFQSQRSCIPSEMPDTPPLSSHEHVSRSTVKTPPDLLLPLVRTSLGFSHECPGDRETLASSITLRCSIRDLGSRMTWRIPDVQWLLNQCQHLG